MVSDAGREGVVLTKLAPFGGSQIQNTRNVIGHNHV